MHHLSTNTLLARGKQSSVYLTPTISKHIGQDKNLTATNINKLIPELRRYQTLLTARGWHIPQTYQMQRSLTEEVRLIVYEQYIPGQPLGRLPLEQALDVLLPSLDLIAHEATTPYIHVYGTFHQLHYGVDLKPDNLVYDDLHDTLYLVDTFAPKTITERGTWRYYSKKLETLSPEDLMIVTATHEGIMLRLFRLLGVTTPQQVEQHLRGCGLAQNERQYILSQITHEYPLLDAIYGKVTYLKI